MFGRLRAYFSGARIEFRAIKWPTFIETRQLTVIVIAISLLLAAFLGVFDYIFTYILGQVLA